MAATRRLQKKLAELRDSDLKSFRNILVDEQNILSWQGLIVPENAPYNKGAFKVRINYPAEYPFTPPKLTFKTKTTIQILMRMEKSAWILLSRPDFFIVLFYCVFVNYMSNSIIYFS